MNKYSPDFTVKRAAGNLFSLEEKKASRWGIENKGTFRQENGGEVNVTLNKSAKHCINVVSTRCLDIFWEHILTQ